jgi:lysophospholipase L1-like esterase
MKRALVLLSVALNALLVAAVVWMVWGPGGFRLVRGVYIEPHHQQLVTQFDAFPVGPGDVVFLGDSITEAGRWHEIFPGVPAKNRGIGGDTASDVLARLQQVTSGRPSKVFLKIGTNDLFAGVPEDEIAADVAEILRRIRAESPGTQVYLQSVLPRAAEWRDAVESLNARLEAVAGEQGVAWLDLYPQFLDASDGSIRDDLSNDELHLLGPGYRVWREQIEAHVRDASAPE